ncbi:MAG TPA: glycosyltransferase [Thermoanaerobaculia bacterium]
MSSSAHLRRFLRDLLPAGLRATYHRYALQRDFGIEVRTGERRAVLDRSLPRGLNVIGYFDSPTGIGQSARALARAAEVAGLAVARIDAAGLETSRPPVGAYASNLFHVNADAAASTVEMCGPVLYRGHANVAYWYWETDAFPARWSDRFAYFDEIWVASEFCRRSIARISPIPVAVVPPPVIVDPAVGERTPSEGPFRFLTICDVESGVERKNPLGAVRAFARAFPSDPGVLLSVKIGNAEAAPDLLDSLAEAAEASNVEVDGRPASRGDVERLLAECDAYVSLHRAEGFGLVIAEAMLLGKPVIATDYSGSRDFVDEAAGFPVPFLPVRLDRTAGPYEAGTRWAEPEEEEAARAMRRVVEDFPEARRRAEVGRRRIASRYGVEPAGRRVVERLETLNARLAARP